MPSNKISRLESILRNPSITIDILKNYSTRVIRPLLSDEQYLKILFRMNLGYWPNFQHPKTYAEKLNWMKLNLHDPEYTIMADKVKAKEWVAERIGYEHIIPTLGIWDRVEDIDFSLLPNKFVIKCNHNSGLGMYICKDKEKMDINTVCKNLTKGLKENYYAGKLEWPYKDIPRKIIAEKYMENNDGTQYLTDYKFFCFNGEPKIMYLSADYSDSPHTDFFDMDYNRLDIRMKDPNSNIIPPKPEKFKEMQEYAKILSKGIPHLRVDFYCINGQVYFGELTFFHNAGLCKIHPKKWEYILGDWIKI